MNLILYNKPLLNNFILYSSQEVQQSFWQRCFALTLLWIGMGRWWGHLGLHQLWEAPFVSPKADLLHWIFHYWTIPQHLIQHWHWGLGIDIGLLLLPILVYRFPKQRIWTYLYLPILLLYMLTYNSIATHHEHTLVGALFVAILLCIKSVRSFPIAFDALRYYTCFIMASAACWKIGRGALLESDQFVQILYTQHSELLVFGKGNYQSWITWLVHQPILCQVLWYLATGLELLFFIGFFTKKWDLWLWLAFWLFLLFDKLIMGLAFWELGILTICFLPNMRRP